jgi:hypothetical protein
MISSIQFLATTKPAQTSRGVGARVSKPTSLTMTTITPFDPERGERR